MQNVLIFFFFFYNADSVNSYCCSLMSVCSWIQTTPSVLKPPSYLKYLWMHVSNNRIGPGPQDTWRNVWRSRSKHVTMRNRQRCLQAFWWSYREGRHVSSSVTNAVKPQRASKEGQVKASDKHTPSVWPVRSSGQESVTTFPGFISSLLQSTHTMSSASLIPFHFKDKEVS